MIYFAVGTPGPLADLYSVASPRPVAGVIVYVVRQFPDERKVLFLKRNGGQHSGAWWPVAGTPEAGEAPQQTAVRELGEETGLSPRRLFSFGMEIPHADSSKALVTFVAFVDQATPVTLNYEHSDYRWLTGGKAIDLVPDHSKLYLDYFREHFIVKSPAPDLEIELREPTDD
jgi:dihydroneopterin triphosphate diphosphatase